MTSFGLSVDNRRPFIGSDFLKLNGVFHFAQVKGAMLRCAGGGVAMPVEKNPDPEEWLRM